MSPEKWEQIKEQVNSQFSVEDQGTEDLVVQTGDGPVKQGMAEFLIFEGPMGRMKLEFGTKPRLAEKQYFYSHQQGKAARVEYKFSEDEVVHTFKVFKWDEREDEWKEIDPSSFQ